MSRSRLARVCLFAALLQLGLAASSCARVWGSALAASSSDRVLKGSPELPGPATVTTIAVWTHESVNSPQFEALRRTAAKFNAGQGRYRAELLSSLNRKYEAWLQGAASTGELPCVFEFDGPYVHELAWSGYLQPLDRFVSAQMVQDFLPSVLAEGRHGGHLYSLGQYESGLALWGNRRYLRQVGVRVPTLRNPWSLEEFEAALRKLAALPGIDYAIDMGMYSSAGEFYTYAYSPILQGFGGDLIDRAPGGRARRTLDGAASVLAMRRLQHWFQQGWARVDLNRAQVFVSGKAALAWSGNWYYAEFLRRLGRDLVLLPLPDFGQGIKTGVGSWVWGISSTCQDPRGAWAFLSLLVSPEEMQRMMEVNSTMPARRSVLERSRLYGPGGPLRLFVEQLDAKLDVPRPATAAYETITTSFATATVGILEGGDAQAQLSEAARRIDAEISRRRGYPHQ